MEEESMKEDGELPAEFCLPDTPDVDLVSQSNDHCNLLPTAIKTAAVPMEEESMEEDGELPAEFCQTIQSTLPTDIDVQANELGSVAVAANILTTPAYEHRNRPLYINEPLQSATADHMRTLLRLVPVTGNLYEEPSNSSMPIESVLLPVSVVSEQCSVQSSVTPFAQDISSSINLADGFYTTVVDNETVVLPISQPVSGAGGVFALPGCSFSSAVPLQSDLLLINTDECEDNTILDSANGGQNPETTVDVDAVSKSRKRQRKTHLWKKNVSKVKRQSVSSM